MSIPNSPAEVNAPAENNSFPADPDPDPVTATLPTFLKVIPENVPRELFMRRRYLNWQPVPGADAFIEEEVATCVFWKAEICDDKIQKAPHICRARQYYAKVGK